MWSYKWETAGTFYTSCIAPVQAVIIYRRAWTTLSTVTKTGVYLHSAVHASVFTQSWKCVFAWGSWSCTKASSVQTEAWKHQLCQEINLHFFFFQLAPLKGCHNGSPAHPVPSILFCCTNPLHVLLYCICEYSLKSSSFSSCLGAPYSPSFV